MIILLRIEFITYSLITSQRFKKKNEKKSNSIIIYYLIQSRATILFLIRIIYSIIPLINRNIHETLLLLSIMMKIGAFPFHFWIPTIIENLNIIGCFYLITIIKIIPLYLISETKPTNLIYIRATLSCFIGCLGIKNQTIIIKILGYSSINHMGWLLICTSIKPQLINYFIMYTLITIQILTTVKLIKIKNIYETFITKNKSKILILINILLLFISIRGIPPFIGFFIKVSVLKSIVEQQNFILAIIILIIRILSIYAYIKVTISIFLIYKKERNQKKIRNNTKKNWTLILQNVIIFFFLFNDLIPIWNFKLKKLLVFKTENIINKF